MCDVINKRQKLSVLVTQVSRSSLVNLELTSRGVEDVILYAFILIAETTHGQWCLIKVKGISYL